MSKLLLVDGSALLHRAYHAYPPLTSRAGEVVGAVYGVASILVAALDSEKPTHVMVAWDLPKPTFRHEKYVGYKAQRPKADAEMVEQIPRVKELIKSMGIVQVEEEGYEADDIIGTLATQMIKPLNHSTIEPLEVVILTGDQDTMQLVTDQVKVLTPAKGANPPVLYGPEEVWSKYGVRPDRIVDYKALVGDVSDNIPGVAGIGPKGASELLQKYGDLASIFANLANIPTNQREKLVAGKDSAFLSQDLSRIVTDMPLKLTLPEMEYKSLQGESLKVELEELGFRSLIRRIWGDPTSPKGSAGAGRNKIPDNQMGLF